MTKQEHGHTITPEYVISKKYPDCFGFWRGDDFKIVGKVDRWDGWEDRVSNIVTVVNERESLLAHNKALEADVRRKDEALRAMLRHSCVADSAPEDKDPEDHAAERQARAALSPAPQPDIRDATDIHPIARAVADADRFLNEECVSRWKNGGAALATKELQQLAKSIFAFNGEGK